MYGVASYAMKQFKVLFHEAGKGWMVDLVTKVNEDQEGK